MPRYEPVNLQQDAFVPIRFKKQILPGTFEYALHHLLEHTVDLSAFDAHYANDALGARTYHPKMLLKIVLFAYARGLIGSRRIERACRENVQFMALSGEAKPDHATIATFISRSPEAIQAVFREVFLVCDSAGLIGREHFAIDGVKLPSNASKALSGRIDALQAKVKKLDRAIERMLKAHHLEDSQDAQSVLGNHAAQQCDAYIADTLYRKRDPRFAEADKYKPPMPRPSRFEPSNFDYDPNRLTCTCPAGKALYRKGANVTIKGRTGIKFSAPKSACSTCHLRARCLRDAQQKTPRQVVFFREPDSPDDTLIGRALRPKLKTKNAADPQTEIRQSR